jgi:hypothetical protein
MGVNPTVEGCTNKGGVVYLGEVHTRPEYNRGATPDYTHQQLHHFRSDYVQRHEVDEVLERIGDKSLVAEVARYRGTMDAMRCLQGEIRKKEDQVYCVGNDN